MTHAYMVLGASSLCIWQSAAGTDPRLSAASTAQAGEFKVVTGRGVTSSSTGNVSRLAATVAVAER